MAQLIITVPDNQVTRVLDGICLPLGWTPSDGTKQNFAKQALIKYAMNLIRVYEGRLADEAARVDVDSNVTLS